MKNLIFIVLLLVGFLTIMGCSKDAETIFQEQKEEIADYLSEKGWTDEAEEIDEGLWLYMTEEGTGVDYPSINSTVTVHYEGRLLDETKFDSSFDRGQASTFPLSGVIEGWRRGIPKFRKGDKGYLIIPSKYGYGSQDKTGIPGNSVLVFYIEMIDF